MSSISREAGERVGRSGVLVFYIAGAVLPIAGSLAYAGLYSVGLVGLLSHGFTLGYWRDALADPEVAAAFGTSFFVAAATLLLTTAASLILALGLQGFLRRGLFGTVIYFPLALPGTVAALCGFQWLSGAGLLARIAYHLGWIQTPNQFPGLVFDRWCVGIILTHVGLATPFFTILFAQLAAREKLAELLALASTLGAGRVARLWRVAVPLLLSRAWANLALFFVAVAGSFEIPLLLGPQNPQMISVLAWHRYSRFDLGQKPTAFIVSLLYTGAVLLFLCGWFRAGRGRRRTA